MATGTVLQFAQNSKIKENYHNCAGIEDFAEQIAAVVPENTPHLVSMFPNLQHASSADRMFYNGFQ